MRIAETVTFGGAGLDRAGEVRGDAGAVAAMLADPAARLLPLWRGKPLVAARNALVWLPLGADMLRHVAEPPILLGRGAQGPLFAADISAWEPAPGFESQAGAFFDPTEQHYPDTPPEQHFVELRGVMAALSAADAECAAMARALFSWHGSHRFCSACGVPSAPRMAGWQRGCPDCGASHFPRTDPVVIMLITQGNNLLLGRSHPWPTGMYSLLAGFVEPGETIEAAVRREVLEETAIRVGPVRYLASQPWPYPNSLMVGCRGEAQSTEITIDPVEIEDARWLPREEVARAVAGEHPDILPPRQGAIAGFLIRNWLADRLD